MCDASTFVLLSQDGFGYLETLGIFFFSMSVKNAFGILVGIGLNLRNALGNIDRNQTLRVVLDYLCLL